MPLLFHQQTADTFHKKFHLLASILIDLQPLYQEAIIPGFLVEVQKGYIADYGDPLVSGLYGLYGEAYKNQIIWFTSFVYCEAYVSSALSNC